MEHVQDKIEAIKIKAKQLALKIERLETENNILQKQVTQLKASGIKAGAGKVVIGTKSTKDFGGKDLEAFKQLKKEVTQYIKEIDKCIDMVKEV